MTMSQCINNYKTKQSYAGSLSKEGPGKSSSLGLETGMRQEVLWRF